MRNDFRFIHRANSHNLKHEQKQNDYAFKHERCRDLRSCLERKFASQFQKKKNFYLNYCSTNNFMQNRHIIFVINNDITTMNNINVDISQEFFILFILYLFYNVNLLKLLKYSFRRIVALNFVNDINILTYKFNITSNCRVLKKIHVHYET